MIYLDTSVALAHLLAADRHPPDTLWEHTLVSSRLLEYEVWVRIHARRLGGTHREPVQALLGRIAFLEMIPEVLARAREPFPVEVRTLDALHLATLQFITEQGQPTRLASYDQRLVAAARKLNFEILSLD